MSSDSPVVVLYDGVSGSAMAVYDSILIPSGTAGLMTMGTDVNNQSRRLKTTTGGILMIDGSAVTQPVTGSVLVNQGLRGTAAGAWPVALYDASGNPFAQAQNASLGASVPLIVPGGYDVTTGKTFAMNIDALGNQIIAGANVLSAQQTNTSMTGSGVWTSSAQDIVTQYASLRIRVITDVSGTLNVKWDSATRSFTNSYTVNGSATGRGANFFLPVEARSFRLSYINGSVAQTLFEIRCYMMPFPFSPIQQDASIATDINDYVTPIGGRFADNASTLGEGQWGAARITSKRAVHINLRDNTGVELGTVGNPLRFDPVNNTATSTTTNITKIAGVNVTNSGTGTMTVGTIGVAAEDTTPGSTINPVVVSGKDATGVVRTLKQDSLGVAYTRPRQLATYTAYYRLASRPYALSNASGGAGRKQFATMYHAAGSTKTVTIQKISAWMESDSAAAITMWDVVRLTSAVTPATGNPAITPSVHNPGDGAAEVTCLALPTTGGTEGVLWASVEVNSGITAAASTVNPPPQLQEIKIFNRSDFPGGSEIKSLVLRAQNAEGLAVIVDVNASVTTKGYVSIIFTEE